MKQTPQSPTGASLWVLQSSQQHHTTTSRAVFGEQTREWHGDIVVFVVGQNVCTEYASHHHHLAIKSTTVIIVGGCTP